MEAPPMTPAEIEIFKLCGQGYSDREIAQMRGTTQSELRTHMKHAIERQGARNRTHLAVLVWLAYGNGTKKR